MSALQSLRRRLNSQSGFTLIELLVSLSIGMIVLLAAGNLLDASGRASAEVQDRVDAVQRGRVATEQLTQRLRSQVCLNSGTPAVAFASTDELWFYTDLGDHTAGFFPEARKLRLVAGASGQNSSLVEDVWDTVVVRPTRAQTAADTFGRPPSRTRTVIADMSLAIDTDDRDADSNKTEFRPLFEYFRFLNVNPNPVTPDDRLTTPLNEAAMERVVRIVATFDARPTRSPRTRNQLDTRFETDVFVRTADPTDPDNSPSCL